MTNTLRIGAVAVICLTGLWGLSAFGQQPTPNATLEFDVTISGNMFEIMPGQSVELDGDLSLMIRRTDGAVFTLRTDQWVIERSE